VRIVGENNERDGWAVTASNISQVVEKFATKLERLGIATSLIGSGFFAETTNLFNGNVSTPAMLSVRPRSETELASIVAIATEAELDVSIKGGGHGVAGRAVHGTIVIDSIYFDKLAYDQSTNLITVGTGVRWADLDSYSSQFGVVVPGGAVSSTGVAGLTLGGGIGWLLPLLGLTCDHLILVRGVSGIGEIIELNDRCHPELMPVVRGCGHGLAAFTEFVFECRSLPSSISAGSIYFSINDAVDVINALMQWSPECPSHINYSPALIWRSGKPILSVDGVAFSSSTGFGDVIRSVVSAETIGSTVRDRTYPELQSMLDNPLRWGQGCCWRSWFGERLLTESQLESLVLGFSKGPKNSDCMVVFERIEGAVREPRRLSSYPFRSAVNNVLIVAAWDRVELRDCGVEWATELVNSLGPSLEGTYVNYSSEQERPSFDLANGALDQAHRFLDPANTFAKSRPC